jgi:beta-phosphoglucomutase-like phosphatase (HAD superfamily)
MLLLQHSLALVSPLYTPFAAAVSPSRASPAVASASAAPQLNSLPDLVGLHDVWLLDQFGVIHDGSVAYAGATQAVAHAQQRGTKICIISNSSRRKGDTIARLRGMG